MLLQRVQEHERSASLHRIMRDDLVDFYLQSRWNQKHLAGRRLPLERMGNRCAHRSHSPMTKSRDPTIATVSLIMWPGSRCDRMLRFTNDGARIFRRCGVPPPRLLM